MTSVNRPSCIHAIRTTLGLATATASRPSSASHETDTYAATNLATAAKISKTGCGRSDTTFSAVTLARYSAQINPVVTTNHPRPTSCACSVLP